MITTKEKVAVYFRCSTDKQDKSIQDQRNAIEQFAVQKKLDITTWFDKDEGRSGTSFEKRPDFMNMVRLIESGHNDFTQILVYDVDRWGRPIDPDESSYWEFHLRRYGVTVTYVTDQHVNENTLAGRLTKKLKQELASDESKKQSLLVRERSKLRAGEGYRVGGFAPYGYKRLLISADGTPGKVLENGERKYEKTQRVILTPGDKQEIATIKEIFCRKAVGRSLREIIDWLNSAEIPAPSATGRLRNGRNIPGKWSISTVHSMLNNPVYVGTVRYNRQIRGSWAKHESGGKHRRENEELIFKENAHEPLIDKETFDNVQSAFRSYRINKRGRSWKESPYLLSGLIYCNKCDYKFHGHIRRSQGKKYRYYECSGFNARGHAVCNQTMIRKEKIEGFVTDFINNNLIPGLDRDRIVANLRRKIESTRTHNDESDKPIKSSIAEIERKLQNIKNSIEQGIEVSFLKDRIQSLIQERKRQEAALEALTKSTVKQFDPDKETSKIMKLVSDLNTYWDSTTNAKKKEMFRHFVHRIEVTGSKRKITCYFYPIPKVLDEPFVGNYMPEVGIEPT